MGTSTYIFQLEASDHLLTCRKMHYQPVEPSENDMYLSQATLEHEPRVINDQLDDIFGDEDDHHENTYESHPSDQRRLQTDYSTAGYREGVNIGKQDSLQKGFDEGYTIGAAIGLQAGQILGVLEGISEALLGDDKIHGLLAEAKDELSVEKLFNGDFWKADGLPSYDVDNESLKGKEGAFAHPSIRKWTSILEEQIRLRSIDRKVLEGAKEETIGKPTDEAKDLSAEAAVENPLDW